MLDMRSIGTFRAAFELLDGGGRSGAVLGTGLAPAHHVAHAGESDAEAPDDERVLLLLLFAAFGSLSVFFSPWCRPCRCRRHSVRE